MAEDLKAGAGESADVANTKGSAEQPKTFPKGVVLGPDGKPLVAQKYVHI